MQAMVENGLVENLAEQYRFPQYNFAGIGALDGGAQGATFKTVREGVRAQIQHFKKPMRMKSHSIIHRLIQGSIW